MCSDSWADVRDDIADLPASAIGQPQHNISTTESVVNESDRLTVNKFIGKLKMEAVAFRFMLFSTMTFSSSTYSPKLPLEMQSQSNLKCD